MKTNHHLALIALSTVLTAGVAHGSMFFQSPQNVFLNGTIKFDGGETASGDNIGPSLHKSIDGGKSSLNTSLLFVASPTPGKFDKMIVSADLTTNGMTAAATAPVYGVNQSIITFNVDQPGQYRISWEQGNSVGNPNAHVFNLSATNKVSLTSYNPSAQLAVSNGVDGAPFSNFNVTTGSALFQAVPGVDYNLEVFLNAYEGGNYYLGGGFSSDYANVTIEPFVPEPASLGLLAGLAPLALRRRRA